MRSSMKAILHMQISVAMLAFLMVLSASARVASGCIAMQKAVRTITDVAEAACEIFGTQHPEEFAELVRNAKPALAPDVEKAGFNVKALCKVADIVQPFIEDQARLQNETAASMRMHMQQRESGGDDAVAPK